MSDTQGGARRLADVLPHCPQLPTFNTAQPTSVLLHAGPYLSKKTPLMRRTGTAPQRGHPDKT